MSAPRVLIIDDSEIVRDMLRSSLEDAPLLAEVHDAFDGEAGLAAVVAADYDCVICDIEMPRLDGMKFLATVRGRWSRTELPVLLLTGHEAVEQKVSGFEAGASDFVAKPWEPAELIARVQTHIELSRMHKRLAERGRELEQSNARLESTVGELRRTSLLLAQTRNDPLERQLEVAQGIQLAMVPPPGAHQLEGARVSGSVAPAAKCGGDFWTFVDAPDHLLLLVGDVTGHGVAAALVTSVVKSCVDTMLLERGGLSPERLLARLDEVISSATQGQLEMSAFVVDIDKRERTMRFGSAGHPRQYLLVRDEEGRRVQSLKARGVALGRNAGAAFLLEERRYQAGDVVVLFTDGVVEHLDPDDRAYGDARLRRCLLDGPAGAPAEALLEHVLADVDSFRRDRPPDDDVTLVVAQLS